jgi:hypothetical protein
MHYSPLLVALATLTSATSLELFRRQSTPGSADYLNSVCSPNITAPTVVPPCISIISIQTACAPNGTSSLDLLASAECLCDAPSSFFADWIACRECLYVHGGLTQLELAQYSAIIGAASTALCTGTPTADFQSLFSAAQTAAASVTSGGTSYSDQFPSQSAVSLYYTPSGSQGVGVITGTSLFWI